MLLNKRQLLSTIAALLVVSGSSTAPAKAAPDAGPVALVNGTPISRAEYDGNLNQMKQRSRMQGRPLDDAAEKAMEKRALDALISQELLIQESRKAGIRVPKTDVAAQMGKFRKQFPSEGAFENALSERSLTVAILEAQIEKGLAIRRFLNERIVDQIKISDAEAKRFYDTNPDLFSRPETIKASHILIKVGPESGADQKAEADKKLKAVQTQIADGKDFAEVARQFSEGPSRTNGGDLGFFGRGQMVPPFEEAAFALAPGQVSDKVVTRFGYHIIKVTDKKPAGTESFDASKETIMRRLKQEKAAQEIKGYVEDLRGKADIQIVE
jgi:peptidyl-prolyl cis-trans isomerase C